MSMSCARADVRCLPLRAGWEDAVLYANTTRLSSGLAYEDVALGDGAPINAADTCVRRPTFARLVLR